MRQVLIRHGESESNREGRVQGQADVDLSETGRLQAEAVADWCREQTWDGTSTELWSSPLKRARETAEAISVAIGLPVQVADASGRVPWSAAAAGVTWAVDQGADIINMSFGGSHSQTLADAVAYAVANDVIVVAAAGNNGTTNEFFPAALDGVLSVAGHDATYGAYSWSNRGPWVDVAGPGCSVGASGGGYSTICGTSFATPVITGMIGLLFDVRGSLPTGVVERVVEAATTPLDYVETGWVDAARVLAVDPATFSLEPAPADSAEPNHRFEDVDPTAYYAEPVAWLVETGATNGTGPTTFSPNETVTRGQLATFLWRRNNLDE